MHMLKGYLQVALLHPLCASMNINLETRGRKLRINRNRRQFASINECLYYCHDYKSQRPKTKIQISYLVYDYCTHISCKLLVHFCVSVCVCVCMTGCVRCYDRLTPYSSIYYTQTATFVPILSFFFAYTYIFNFIIHSAQAIKKLLRKYAVYILYYVYHIYIHHIYIAADNANARLAALHNDLTNCAINTVQLFIEFTPATMPAATLPPPLVAPHSSSLPLAVPPFPFHTCNVSIQTV